MKCLLQSIALPIAMQQRRYPSFTSSSCALEGQLSYRKSSTRPEDADTCAVSRRFLHELQRALRRILAAAANAPPA